MEQQQQPRDLSPARQIEISQERGESISSWWQRAHKNDEILWITGTPPTAVWQRLDVMERLEAGAVVLDIGVGFGTNARALAERGCTVHALDISRAALERVEAFATVWQHPHDLSRLPVSTFDVAMSYLVSQHMKTVDLEQQIRSVLPALKPAGMFAMQYAVPHDGGDYEVGTNDDTHAKSGGVLRSDGVMRRLIEACGGAVLNISPRERGSNWAHQVVQFRRA